MGGIKRTRRAIILKLNPTTYRNNEIPTCKPIMTKIPRHLINGTGNRKMRKANISKYTVLCVRKRHRSGKAFSNSAFSVITPPAWAMRKILSPSSHVLSPYLCSESWCLMCSLVVLLQTRQQRTLPYHKRNT